MYAVARQVRVGSQACQSLAAKLDDDGEYANESRPAAWNTVAYSDGARLSELTIKRETTVGAMSPSAVHQ